MSGNPIPPEELERQLKLRVAQVRADMVRHYVRKQRHGLYRFIAPFRKPLMPLAAVLGVIVIAAAVSAFIDGGTLDVQVADKTGYAVDTTTSGAIVEYIGDSNTSFGSSGTGTFGTFLQVQHDPSERGYNTDGARQFDTGSSPTFNKSILVSDIPTVPCKSLDGSKSASGLCWELFADINDSNANDPSAAHIQLTDLEVWLTGNKNITSYPFSTSPNLATNVYDFAGNVLINDVNQGSGRGDLRYLVPVSSIDLSTLAPNCDYKDLSCATYFVLYTAWGDPQGGTYKSDSGFEEWKVKVYPTLQIVKNTVGGDGTFGFTVTGPSASTPNITTLSGTGTTGTFAVNPGTYGITESTIPAGWDLTGAVCSFNGGNPTAYTPGNDLVIGETDHVVCTFTDTLRGTIKLVKNTIGGDGIFAFTNTGATGLATSLTTVGGTANDTSDPLVPGNTYAVGETVPTGWTLTSAVCKLADGTTVTGTLSGSNITGITVEAGKTTTCTFTDTAQGAIKLVKNTIGGDGIFAFTNTGATGLATSLTTVGGTANDTSDPLVPGNTYAVGETVPTGWTLTSAVCKLADGTTVTGTLSGSNITGITVEAGKTTTCTFTDTAQGAIKLVKNTIGGDGIFAFTNTGATGLATSLTTVGGTANDTSDPLVPGNTYAVGETVPTGWTLTSAVCKLADGTTVTGTLSGSNITGITVEAGKTTTCTFTDSKLPTIIVQKITTGSFGGPFNFTTTGGHGFTTPFSLTTTATGLPGLDQKTFTIDSGGIGGNFSVIEGITAGFVLTDVSCTVTTAGAAGTTTGSNVGTRTGTITNLTAGTTVTCTFTNSGALTTRTQGFWATHSWLVALVWSPSGTTVGGITTNGMTDAERTLCGSPLTVNQVMGGFWANIAKTSTGVKRSALDQARMQLLQQLLAAILNNQLFGSSPSGSISIDQAKAAFCGTDITAIRNAQAAMAAFNTSGDSGVFTPGQSADAKTARAIADIAFWDVLPK